MIKNWIRKWLGLPVPAQEDLFGIPVNTIGNTMGSALSANEATHVNPQDLGMRRTIEVIEVSNGKILVVREYKFNARGPNTDHCTVSVLKDSDDLMEAIAVGLVKLNLK